MSKVIIGISPLESSVKIKNVPGFLDQWYDKRKKKNVSLRSRILNHLDLHAISPRMTWSWEPSDGGGLWLYL